MFYRTLIWPPPYSVTKMKRARHVIIKVTLQKGLEFVVPTRFKKKDIPKLLKLNKVWIKKQLLMLYQELREIRTASLPKKITLSAARQTWKVRYKRSPAKPCVIEAPKEKVITLMGKIHDKSVCKDLLNAWVKEKAKIILPKKLARLSASTGLKFKGVSIRNQSGRWASCSPEKRINLNFKLIFLSATLCKHILIHELCHTKHLDHSKGFWKLVAKQDAHWKQNNKAMRASEKLIPTWSRE